MEASGTWFFWALLSAGFAALTAVFAKIGLTGIDSDLATLVRTSTTSCGWMASCDSLVSRAIWSCTAFSHDW